MITSPIRDNLRTPARSPLAAALATRYETLRNAAIAAARRNDASLWFAGAPADLAGFVWQDSAGTTPATGTDPIGLLLDRQYGAANLGPELAGPLNTWTPGTGWAVAGSTLVASAAGAFSSSSVAAVLVAGKTYRVEYTISAYSAGAVRLRFLTGTATTAIDRTSAGTFSEFIVANPSNATIAVQAGASGFTGAVSAVSVREILGIPALQATAANKQPTLELQANGYYGMRFDGTSDLLSFTGIAPTEDVSVIAATTSNPAAGTIIHMSSGGPQLYFGTPQIRLARSDVANFLVGSFPAAPAVYSAVIDSRVGFLRANGSVLSGPTATPSDFTGAAIGTIGAKTGGSEFLSSAIMLCCASANAMPDADRIAIERFAALLSGATYA